MKKRVMINVESTASKKKAYKKACKKLGIFMYTPILEKVDEVINEAKNIDSR